MGKRHLPSLHLGALVVSAPSGPSHVSHSSVTHEHRAPTDESVRLLEEMQEKALDSVVQAFRIENNTFSASWHVLRDDFGMQSQARCRFILNGEKHEFTIDLPEQRFRDMQEVAKEVHQRVIERLSAILAVSLFTQAMTTRPGKPGIHP